MVAIPQLASEIASQTHTIRQRVHAFTDDIHAMQA